jgi:hypothetical protein
MTRITHLLLKVVSIIETSHEISRRTFENLTSRWGSLLKRAQKSRPKAALI